MDKVARVHYCSAVLWKAPGKGEDVLAVCVYVCVWRGGVGRPVNIVLSLGGLEGSWRVNGR